MNVEKIKEKHPQVKELSPEDQERLFVMMEAFQESAQETIAGGEGLYKMCDGCAFKKGTEASDHPITSLVAIECVLKEEAFYCHKRFNSAGEEKICNGWINVMNNK